MPHSVYAMRQLTGFPVRMRQLQVVAASVLKSCSNAKSFKFLVKSVSRESELDEAAGLVKWLNVCQMNISVVQACRWLTIHPSTVNACMCCVKIILLSFMCYSSRWIQIQLIRIRLIRTHFLVNFVRINQDSPAVFLKLEGGMRGWHCYWPLWQVPFTTWVPWRRSGCTTTDWKPWNPASSRTCRDSSRLRSVSAVLAWFSLCLSKTMVLDVTCREERSLAKIPIVEFVEGNEKPVHDWGSELEGRPPILYT